MPKLTPAQRKVLAHIAHEGIEGPDFRDEALYRRLRSKGLLVICGYSSLRTPLHTITDAGRKALEDSNGNQS